MPDTPNTQNRIVDLARELLTLELELGCLHGDRRLRDRGVAEQVHQDILPKLLERWKDEAVMGPVQIMAMRHEVEHALKEWLDRERTPYPEQQPKKGIVVWIWHCIRRPYSV